MYLPNYNIPNKSSVQFVTKITSDYFENLNHACDIMVYNTNNFSVPLKKYKIEDKFIFFFTVKIIIIICYNDSISE